MFCRACSYTAVANTACIVEGNFTGRAVCVVYGWDHPRRLRAAFADAAYERPLWTGLGRRHWQRDLRAVCSAMLQALQAGGWWMSERAAAEQRYNEKGRTTCIQLQACILQKPGIHTPETYHSHQRRNVDLMVAHGTRSLLWSRFQ